MKPLLPLLLLLLAGATSMLRAQPYLTASGGLAAVHWRTTGEDTHTTRWDVAAGWQFAPWIALEASVFQLKATPDVWFGPPASPVELTATPTTAVAQPVVLDPAARYLPRETFVATQLEHRVNGFAFGPVWSGALVSRLGLRWRARFQLVHTAVEQTGYLTSTEFYSVSHQRPVGAWGWQAGGGIDWQPKPASPWHLALEGEYFVTDTVAAAAVTGSARYDFDRPAPTANTPLYLAAGGGAAVVAWHAADSPSIVSLKTAALGWRLAPWVSVEASAFQTGLAHNTRVQSFVFTPLFIVPVTIVIPGQPITTPVPPPPYNQDIRWTLRRSFDALAAGPVFSWAISPQLRFFTGQKIALTTAHEWGQLLSSSTGYIATHKDHGWRYLPGAGIDWNPAAVPRVRLALEATSLALGAARMTGVTGSVNLGF